VAEIFAQKGKKGLESLKGVGKCLAKEIEHQLQDVVAKDQNVLG
jgi:hypothetical protein